MHFKLKKNFHRSEQEKKPLLAIIFAVDPLATFEMVGVKVPMSQT
jgi:hypothetical protein